MECAKQTHYKSSANLIIRGEIKMKKQTEKKLLRKAEKTFAKCAFVAAKFSANTTCVGPYYEPKQPKELEQLKR